MSDLDAVVEAVGRILSEHEAFSLTPEVPWDRPLWNDLAASGFTGVGVPEKASGAGGEFSDAVAVTRVLAAGAAAVPVGEQLLVAAPALVTAGLDLPPVEEPLSFAFASSVTAEPVDAASRRFALTGTATGVPWAGVASHIALVASSSDVREGAVLALVDSASLDVNPSVNLAGEPRGSVTFEIEAVPGAVLPVTAVQNLRARFATLRAVQLAAALEQVLELTVQYANERHQFGRALSRFQAVQMHLAEMAGEVTSAGALTDAAVEILARGDEAVLAAAAAKIRSGAAVEVVARRAHQVHGAIGFTQEHRLQHLTRRLWSWRDEAGTERSWSAELAEGVIAGGADDLWDALTRVV